MINLLVGLAMCYVLIKIPFWVLRSVKGNGSSFIGGLIRGAIAYKTLGLIRGRGGRGRKDTRDKAGPAEPEDPYAKARTDSRGQYLLPFEGLKRRKPRKPPDQRRAPQQPTPRPRRGPDRQLMLPVDGEWPENKPVLGRDGQYRLAMPVERRPRPTPPDPASEHPRNSGRSRQTSLPLGRAWPENRPRWPAPDKDGQYRLPLQVRRRPRPAPPPPPPPQYTAGDDQQLPLIEVAPQRWPRADRHGQYPLPLDVPRQPRPTSSPPPADPPPRPRRRPHPQLPLQPRPTRSRPRRSSGGPR